MGTISISNRQKALPLSPASVRRMVGHLFSQYQLSCDGIAIHFVEKKRIADLHAEFFNDPSPTDCITFPIDGPAEKGGFLGEVFACPAVACEWAKKHQEDPYKELSLYVVHGFLHLLGYDDLEPKARKKMKQEERRCMRMLQDQKLLVNNTKNKLK